MTARETLHEDVKPFGLSWSKNMVQNFGSLLHEDLQPVHACSAVRTFRSWIASFILAV